MLRAQNLGKSFDAQTIFHGVSLTLGPRSRVGIVGPNGIGKTTLLRILAGLETADDGQVTRSPESLTVGYLPQEADFRGGEVVVETLARLTGVGEAETRLDELAAELESDVSQLDAYHSALEHFVALGGGDFEDRCATVCGQVGLTPALLEQPGPSLSGGEASRVGLAAVMLSRYDVLLLDEPTNNLDFAGIEQIESFLGSYSGGLAVVSHDRVFLERVVDSVLELNEGTRDAALYTGGWLAYLDEKASAQQRAQTGYDQYVGERQRLQKQIRDKQEWAQKGAGRAKRKPDPDKFVQFKRVSDSQGVASKAKAAEGKIARLKPVAKPWQGWRLNLQLESAPRSGEIVFTLNEAVADVGGFRLGPISLEVYFGDRIAITGRNGAGKSTLLKALLGEIQLSGGTRHVGARVVVGTLDQDRSLFLSDASLLSVVCEASGLVPEEARNLLAKFGLSADHIARPSNSLSPGERTRSQLAIFSAQGVNCLILDEPTNHLDLPALEQLESALETYDGTLILVSHDRYLLSKVATGRRIEVEAERATVDGKSKMVSGISER